MVTRIENIKLRGIVTALPTEIEDDSRYIDILGEQRVKKQRRITGVKERRIDDGTHTAADYCISAAKQLLRQLDWERDQIKVMVFVTQNPSLIMPSTAFIIQNYLGLPKSVWCLMLIWDVQALCRGFILLLLFCSNMVLEAKDCFWREIYRGIPIINRQILRTGSQI